MKTSATLHQAPLSVCVHVLSTATLSQTVHQFFTVHSHHRRQSFGSHYQYLTVIALLISLLTCCVALAHSIVFIINSRLVLSLDRLHRILRFIATPVEITIAVTYWSLYVVDPGLLAEKRSLPPLQLDIGLHLLPAVFLILDFVSLPPQKCLKLDRRVALVYLGIFLGCYSLWLEECHRRNGFWAYPILERLGAGMMALFYVGGILALGGIRELVVSWSLVDEMIQMDETCKS